MQLATLVNTSSQVAATRSRLKKKALLSTCLREAGVTQVGLAVDYLGGTLPQGRIGLGPAIFCDLADGIDSALGTLGEAVLEYKLDGARVQVHRVGNDVRIFSRALNDVTESLLEIVEATLALPVESVILDGEAIALRDDGRPLPFQVSMRRFGRKTNVDEMRGKLPMSVFFFDTLHWDGADLIDSELNERLAHMEYAMPDKLRVPRLVTAEADAAGCFLRDALNAGHEGIMDKSLGSPYAAGNRGADWLKVKHAHTLDLVVLAAEWGSDRRKGWLSNLHPGALDPRGNGFVMLGKTFKGMTDQMLQWQTKTLLDLEIGREGHVVHVKPELVVEIAANEIQASQQYPGGMALRFARVKRYRKDKQAAEADTIDMVGEIFRQQTAGPAPT